MEFRKTKKQTDGQGSSQGGKKRKKDQGQVVRQKEEVRILMIYISRELVHIDLSRSAFRLNGWFRKARKLILPFFPVDHLPASKELTEQHLLPFVIYARITSNFLAGGGLRSFHPRPYLAGACLESAITLPHLNYHDTEQC